MARKKQETLVLFPEVAECTKKMTDAQFGALMRAVFAYRFAGEVYDGDDLIVDIVFGIVAGQVDRYREVCEINRNHAKAENPSAKARPGTAECGEIQRNDPPIPIPYPIPSPIPYPSPIPGPYPVPNNGSGAAQPPTPTRLGPPKAKEGQAGCQGNGLTFAAPEGFANFYLAKGWKVGRDPMRDRKAAVPGWNSRDKPKPKIDTCLQGGRSTDAAMLLTRRAWESRHLGARIGLQHKNNLFFS